MILLIIVVAIVGWAVFAYNRLVSLRNQVDNSWRQIDVQLKRRHDLIPNLVEAVKGYMQFERDTLTQVVEARAKAISAPDQGSRMAAENQITTGLGRLLAVIENYPQLKADENVLKLQEELIVLFVGLRGRFKRSACRAAHPIPAVALSSPEPPGWFIGLADRCETFRSWPVIGRSKPPSGTSTATPMPSASSCR